MRYIYKRQYESAKAQGWLPHFADAAAKYGFPIADLMAIASRESNMKNIKGDFRGGIYHGYSLMQLDIGSHRAWIESGAWKDPSAAILKGAEALAEKRAQILNAEKRNLAKVKFRSGREATFKPKPLTGAALRHCTLASYNCGGAAYYHYSIGNDIDRGTTGKDYGRDVIARASFFQEFLEADKFAPSKRVTVKPSKPAPSDNQDNQTPARVEQAQGEVSNTSNGDTVQDSISLVDVKNRVSSETVKSILVKAGAKVSGPIVGLWTAGAHGKVLIIVAVLIIAGVVGYETWKHWPRIKGWTTTLLK